jgi:hypothetical protein
MGPAVLAQLKQLTPLPSQGIVAGQAVASALEDIYGKGGGVYNDVDLFVQVDGPFRQQDDKVEITAQRYVADFALRATHTSPDDYDHMKVPMLPTAVPSMTYSVVGVARTGLLNRVFYRNRGAAFATAAQRLISGFDLNCVRVAIDLATEHLVWDRHFEQFIRTNELRVAAIHTPLHSFLRALRKRDELPNVVLDLDTTASICWALQDTSVARLLRESNSAAYWFGDKYRHLAQELSTELSPFFSLKEWWVSRDAEGQVVQGAAADETHAGVFLGTLEAKGRPDLDFLTGFPEPKQANIALWPERIYRERHGARATTVQVPDWVTRYGDRTWLGHHQQMYGPGFWEGVSGQRAVGRLEQVLSEQSPLLAGLPVREQLQTLVQANAAAAATGVPDVDDVAAIALAVANTPTALNLLETAQLVVERQRAQFSCELAKTLLLRDEAWRPHTSHPDAQVTILRTVRDLREFLHRFKWAGPYQHRTRQALSLGLYLGRHARDVSILHFDVDRATGQLNWRMRLRKRLLMPKGLLDEHLNLATALHHELTQQGLRIPFSTTR